MFDDDDRPKPLSDIVIGADLATISIEELEKRITILEAEISRLREEIVSKQATKASAENFFKS
ncbi:MAG: DUF1192 domain-containing protein [Pseudomonadota bacterium]